MEVARWRRVQPARERPVKALDLAVGAQGISRAAITDRDFL